MPINPSTAGSIVAGVGVGAYGVARWVTLKQDESSQLDDTEQQVPFARTIMGQTLCATVAGWFQVYSGGIVVDTVATRLQAGLSPSQALWGVETMPPASDLTMRLRCQMLYKSNLFAGHFVTMLSRFPYLFLNFNSYTQTEQLLLRRNGGDLERMKTLPEEFICVTVATAISTAAISAAECPKILDQLKGGGGKAHQRETVYGIISKYGPGRLMQGYTACFCREYLFNVALLGSPAVAARLREHYVLPNREESSVARRIDGSENFLSALFLGIGLGFITNGPDQLKTNIQKGQFLNMREAIAWQRKQPGGLLALYGRAARWRALYIMQTVVAINFAREKVEGWMNSMTEEDGYFQTVFGG